MAGQNDNNAGFKRVAFGNGEFVVGGQDGPLASTRDGHTWHNNDVHPERGDISAVVWAGDKFLACGKNGGLISTDGLAWKSIPEILPRQMVRAGDWVYGWSWPRRSSAAAATACTGKPFRTRRSTTRNTWRSASWPVAALHRSYRKAGFRRQA